MDAVERTNSLLRMNLPVGQLLGNDLNPNQMTDQEFNLLTDNIERMGITDPILVRPHPQKAGMYRIVGGHHRFEVAKLIGFAEVPCTVVTDPAFDEDQEQFQVVRHNMIRGRLSPDKFLKMYESLGDKYSQEVLQEAFGFAREEDFKKLVKSIEKDLPADMKDSFKQAAKEIKTVDGLSALLNSLFTAYGDTLPYGYMLLDFGGKESVWLRMSSARKKQLLVLADYCKTNQRSMDDIVGGLIAKAAAGELGAALASLVAHSKQVAIPDDYQGLPTEDNLQGVS